MSARSERVGAGLSAASTEGRRRSWDGALARCALALAFAALLALRMPEVVLHGRLWGEEGAVFYPRAAALPWREALFQVYGGYLNVAANAAPILAHALVPLEAVPWVTTGVGLVFQCCPAVPILCSGDAWLRPAWVRVAALLLIATAPLVEEVWLQTLHSQFHLALCCALILALDLPGRKLRAFSLAALFLGPLCGPSAAALLPLFLLRALWDRSLGRLAQAAALGAGTALQVGLFYTHDAGRSYGIGPVVLLCVIYIKQVVVPLAGRQFADKASQAVQDQLAEGMVPWLPVLATLGAFAATVAALLRRWLQAPAWLFLGACVTGLIAYYGAIDGGTHLMIIGNEGAIPFFPKCWRPWRCSASPPAPAGPSAGPRAP